MKQFISFLLAGILVFSAAGCKRSADAGAVSGSGPVKLTMWAPLMWVGKVTDYQDNIAWQNVQRATDTEITFLSPPAGQEGENFNLMIASDTLPDMIMSNWAGDGLYSGGIDKYVNDGVIIRLNELVEKHAPDYLKCIETFVPADERKEFYTDAGHIAVFYSISPYEEWTYSGIQYRQDWMDELGFKNPETIEEVERVLTAFRDRKGAKSPLLIPPSGLDENSGIFLSAFGLAPSFYQKNSVVYYSHTDTGFKQYLALLNDWYNKGLIDRDFPTRDDDAWKRLLTTGDAGACIQSPDTVGDWMLSITSMMGGNFPVLKPGERVPFRLKTFRARPPYNVSVTSGSKNPEAAVRFLNYGYTEPGWMEYNYGQEGKTYHKTGETFEINGVSFPRIKYTDLMMNNPEYSILDAILKYKVHIGPFLRFEHEGNPAINQNTAGIRQFWTETGGTEINLPPTTLTADESREYNSIMSEVSPYESAIILEFILGKQSLDKFDEYAGTIKRLGIDRAIAIQQAALNRYNTR
jgi:putative aldouronate transport system substrate-binding protein